MTYLVDLMNKQYYLNIKVNNINLFIYIMTRALEDLAFSEYLFGILTRRFPFVGVTCRPIPG